MAEAVQLARISEPAAHAAFDRAGHAIGLAAYDLFAEQVGRAFTAQAFGAAGRCALVIRPIPFEEWARGAAAVSIQALFSPWHH